jgi:hypothetical protein
LTGRKKGAMTQFKRKQARQLFSHCSGHKLALVASDAADSVEGMDEFDKAVRSFVNHFAHFVKCREAFKEMQVLVEDAKVSLMRKDIKVRWLSKGQSISQLNDKLVSLERYLVDYVNEEATTRKDSQCLDEDGVPIDTLLHRGRQYYFLLMVCGTDDIVGKLNLVSQVLQLANVTGRQAQIAAKALQAGLKVWETADTKHSVVLMPKTSEMLNMVSTTSSMSIGSDVKVFPFSRGNPHNLPSAPSFSVKIDEEQHNLAMRRLKQFAMAISEECEDCFGDLGIIADLDILDLSSLPSKEDPSSEYGFQAMLRLIEHFGTTYTEDGNVWDPIINLKVNLLFVCACLALNLLLSL